MDVLVDIFGFVDVGALCGSSDDFVLMGVSLSTGFVGRVVGVAVSGDGTGGVLTGEPRFVNGFLGWLICCGGVDFGRKANGSC